MKKIWLVIENQSGDPELVAAAETVEKANQISDLIPLSSVEESAIPLYEAGEVPHMVEVFWASYVFDPARDENGHPLATKPGRLVIEYGAETGLDAYVSDPEVSVYPLGRKEGWQVIATGYRDQETAGAVAADAFNLELARRGLTVRDTELG